MRTRKTVGIFLIIVGLSVLASRKIKDRETTSKNLLYQLFVLNLAYQKKLFLKP